MGNLSGKILLTKIFLLSNARTSKTLKALPVSYFLREQNGDPSAEKTPT